MLVRFSAICAVASLAGALAHTRVASTIVTYFFAALVVLAGLLAALGVAERLRFGRRGGWVAGAASGFFGGFAGEQGGLRALGLLGHDLRKEAFVATTTAVGGRDRRCTPARLRGRAVVGHRNQPDGLAIGAATAGVVLGTIVGQVLLRRIPERVFQRILAAR